MIMYKISVAIIAGGEAKRFNGQIKSNIVIAGKTIISRMLEEVSGIFSEIIIVTNTPAEFSNLPGVRLVPDHFRGIGPLGGIHAAIKASTSRAVFTLAGDMPLISKEIIRAQIEMFEKSLPDAVIPRTGEYIEPLHSIYSNSVLDKLENYILRNNNHAVWEFVKIIDPCWFIPKNVTAASNSFISVNSPDDAAMIEKILQNLI